MFVVGRLPTSSGVQVRHVREAILEESTVPAVDTVVIPCRAEVNEAAPAADEANDSHEHVLSLLWRWLP